MPATNPTFVFDDNGKAYAYVAGKIVASADDADELETQLQRMADESPASSEVEDKSESKGKQKAALPFVPKDKQKDDSDDDSDDKPLPFEKATHVTTPNGLKGTILGKQKGLWGDQVTIRLENGRIAKFDVAASDEFKYSNENEPYPTKHNYVAKLQEELDKTYDGTRASLVKRVEELKLIKENGANFIRSASYTDGETVDNIIVQADYELREVTDALSALEDAEPYAPPAPFETGVIEQEAMGGGDSSWLDNAVEQMVSENEAQDFDALLEEGPDTFVAELETPVLEDAGVTNEYADQFVSSKTAGLKADAVADFRAAFLANVEHARQMELASRAEASEKIAKEAASEDNDGDASGLFW